MRRYTKDRRLPKRELSDETMKTYIKRDMLGEENDCSVRAVTVLTGKPYEEVHVAFEKAGRQKKGGVNDFQTANALKTLGFQMKPLGPTYHRHKKWGETKPEWVAKITDQYPGHHKDIAGLTTYHPRKFPEVWAKMPPLLFLCRKHYAAFKDGVVHDWAANKPQQILRAYTIEPLSEAPAQAPEPAAEGRRQRRM